ncbi:protein IMPACT-B-like [Homalodisca vitripennis]|uniref:protein IMPACT-B-like n=1 Tax=Homalodisca vitripennis TaxID=197043 RepID=UPI001EEB13E6|nr:protein IMPACT-B-like [Homalodisca vitripennis]
MPYEDGWRAIVEAREGKHTAYAPLARFLRFGGFTDGEPGRSAQHCDDDRENSARRRLLHLLQTTGVITVMEVVSRWRGGVNIGPDRFRHINSVARQVLQQLGFVKKSSDQILLQY